jgi:Rad3-related DNA helicase
LEVFNRPAIVDLARRYEICPFEFSLDLALWADCIIGDYNYVFDPNVYLRRFFDNVVEPYVFLIDEAHNLPDRARAMYSAELDKQEVLALRRTLKPFLPDLAKTLGTMNQALLAQRKLCDTSRAGAGGTRAARGFAQSYPPVQPAGRSLVGPEPKDAFPSGPARFLLSGQYLPAHRRHFFWPRLCVLL